MSDSERKCVRVRESERDWCEEKRRKAGEQEVRKVVRVVRVLGVQWGVCKHRFDAESMF